MHFVNLQILNKNKSNTKKMEKFFHFQAKSKKAKLSYYERRRFPYFQIRKDFVKYLMSL